MNQAQQAAFDELVQALEYHMDARKVAEGQGLISPFAPQQPRPDPDAAQGAGVPGAPLSPGMPAPQMPGQMPGQIPEQMPPQPRPPVNALLSKAPPPIDPTQIASVKNRGRNALMTWGTGAGRSAGANANRAR